MEGRPGKGRLRTRTSGHVDNKQERTTMQGKSAEGLPADPRESLAANEDFAGAMDDGEDLEPLTGSRSGWDPYDVWRTRVKNSSVMKEREADPRR
jgi:hypothetical protein